MNNKEFDLAFRRMVVHEASRDNQLRGAHEWLLLGKTDRLYDWRIYDIDSAELYADVADKYGLSPEEVQQAVEICEMNILERPIE